MRKRPSAHIRRVKTRNGIKKVVVNPHIRRRNKDRYYKVNVPLYVYVDYEYDDVGNRIGGEVVISTPEVKGVRIRKFSLDREDIEKNTIHWIIDDTYMYVFDSIPFYNKYIGYLPVYKNFDIDKSGYEEAWLEEYPNIYKNLTDREVRYLRNKGYEVEELDEKPVDMVED